MTGSSAPDTSTSTPRISVRLPRRLSRCSRSLTKKEPEVLGEAALGFECTWPRRSEAGGGGAVLLSCRREVQFSDPLLFLGWAASPFPTGRLWQLWQL